HQTIRAEHRAQIGGDVSILVGGDRQEQLGGRWAVEADGAIHLVSGQAIVIEAPDITLKGAGGFVRVCEDGVMTHPRWAEVHPGAPGAGEGSDPTVPERPALATASFPGLPVPSPNVRRLPVLGFPGLGVPLSPAVDLEKGVICDAMCSCKDSTTALGNRNPDGCTRTRLWAYDRALGNKSTIKAQVPYDMSQIPPVPVMSRNDPSRPKTKPDKGTSAPDVVLVKDPNRPPTQDNIKKVIEIKFPGDSEDEVQNTKYKTIAGGAPYEVWTLEDCGCPEKKRDPIRVPVPTGERVKVK